MQSAVFASEKRFRKRIEYFFVFLKFSVDKCLITPYTFTCSGDKAEQNKYAPLAQLAEHLTLNQGVQGSNP